MACDVDNPLPGPSGAAAVYGAQKGAGPEDVAVLDDRARPLGRRSRPTAGADVRTAAGAGAAGGVGFAALAVLGAEMRPGIDADARPGRVRRTAGREPLVVTGEGSLDEQSLRGKAPVGVAAGRGRRRAGGGRVRSPAARHRRPAAAGIRAAYALLDHEPDPEVCMREPAPLLRLGATIARDHLG